MFIRRKRPTDPDHNLPRISGKPSKQRLNLPSKLEWWLHHAGITIKDDKLHVHWMAYVAIFCYLVTYAINIAGTVDARHDTNKFFENFSIVTFCGMGLLKIMCILKNYADWNCLFKIIIQMEARQLDRKPSAEEYESDDENDEPIKFIEHVKNYDNRFQSLINVLCKIYLLTDIIYTVAPFAEYFLLRLTGVETADWPHILPGSFVFGKISLQAYGVLIVMEFIAACYCAYMHTVFDITSVAMCIFICGQFRILRDYSQNIAGAGKNWKLSPAREERAHHRIIECHKMHILLKKATDILRQLLTNILGVYIFIATFTFCSVAAIVNGQVLSTVQLISWMQYMVGLLTQLFLFCYFGDNVLHQSSVGMGEGPFSAAHWSVSSKIRKELSILAVGMAQPERLHAGPFVFVTLPSFVQVIRTTYSYYAIIRN